MERTTTGWRKLPGSHPQTTRVTQTMSQRFMSIPGMTEMDERATLYATARSIDFSELNAIEFGAFFGASTAAIAEGMAASSKTARLYVCDSFSCKKAPGFYPHLMRYVKNHKITSGIIERGGNVDFSGVYESFTKYLNNLKTKKCTAEDFTYDSDRKIGLIHFDLPKFWEELRTLLRKVEGHYDPGTTFIFQDYFYAWSSGIVAAVNHFIERGFLKAELIKANSLYVKVINPISSQDMIDFETISGNQEKHRELLAQSRKIVAELSARVTMSEQDLRYTKRTDLCIIQSHAERGQFEKAAEHLKKCLSEGVTKDFMAGFLEIFQNGFSIRKNYINDHAKH